jgi:hypothetical protein
VYPFTWLGLASSISTVIVRKLQVIRMLDWLRHKYGGLAMHIFMWAGFMTLLKVQKSLMQRVLKLEKYVRMGWETPLATGSGRLHCWLSHMSLVPISH